MPNTAPTLQLGVGASRFGQGRRPAVSAQISIRSETTRQHRLEILLFAGTRLRRDVAGDGAVGDLSEGALARQDGFAFGAVPTGVTLVDEVGERAVGDELLGVQQRAGRDVDRADMRLDEIDRIDRLAADLGVEVEPAGREAAVAQNLVQHQGQLAGVHRELVGVPAQQRIAPVEVDRAEDAERIGERDFVLERVAGEVGVVLLDVDFHVFGQPPFLQEAVDGRDVIVVLVLGRLARLGLDEQRSLEADLVLVLHRHGQEAAHLLVFPRKIGVEQRFVALASAPQHVVPAAQAVGRFEAGADGGGGEGEHVGIGIGRGASHIAAVLEEVGGAPQQLDLGGGLSWLKHVHHRREVLQMLADRLAYRRHVCVVEGVERNVEQAEQVEGDFGLGPGHRHRIGATHPRAQEGFAAEGIVAWPAERVPVADGEAQVVFHAPAGDDAVLVVIMIGERIGARWTFIADRVD